MATLSINNKNYTFSNKATFLVEDNFVEINKTPSLVFYQKELGILPTGLNTNVLYYNWQPGTLMTIITGTTDSVAFEIYWMYSYKRNIYMFTESDLSSINQELIKTFKYGMDDKVVFNDIHQELSILAESGSTVNDAREISMHFYDAFILDGTISIDTNLYILNGMAVDCKASCARNGGGWLFGVTDDTYYYALNISEVAPNTGLIQLVRPTYGLTATSTYDNSMATRLELINYGKQQTVWLDNVKKIDTLLNKDFVNIDTRTLYIGDINNGNETNRKWNGRIDKFIVRDFGLNNKNIWECIPASINSDTGLYIREWNNSANIYKYRFLSVPGLNPRLLNDNRNFTF